LLAIPFVSVFYVVVHGIFERSRGRAATTVAGSGSATAPL
jgi:hypothetical protein